MLKTEEMVKYFCHAFFQHRPKHIFRYLSTRNFHGQQVSRKIYQKYTRLHFNNHILHNKNSYLAVIKVKQHRQAKL